MKSFTLKIRGGVEVDSKGKKAGKGALIQEELSATLGASQDQILFQAVESHPQDSRYNIGEINQPLSANMAHDALNGGGVLMAKKSIGVDRYNQCTTGAVSASLKCPKGGDNIPCVIIFEPGIASRDGGHVYEGVSGTLRATPGDNQMTVAFTTEMTPKADDKGKAFSLRERGYKDPQAIAIENHPNDSRVRIDDSGTVQTLTQRMGTGGGNVPMVVICLQGNGIDRADTAGCNGKGWKEDVSYTLNTIDRPAVVYPKKTGTLMANSHPGSYCGQDAYNDMLVVENRGRCRVCGMVKRLPYAQSISLQVSSMFRGNERRR